MDAFDNPAKNGLAAPQSDGQITESSGYAAAGSDFLAAAANVTAAASAIPMAIQGILIPDASGRIVLPAGVTMDDISVAGNDLLITLPNGQVLIVPNGAIDIPAIMMGNDFVPANTVAQLLEGLDDLNPEAGLRSSGGNFADPEGNIQDAYALGDLLPYTELAFPEPRDEEIIPDLLIPDEDATVVIQTPDQPAGSSDATASVDEAGLPARGSEPAGRNATASSETTTGTIVINAPDGLASVTINGTAVTAVGQTITTPLGTLTITSIVPGAIGYSYTLADNTDANANPADVFAVVVTDIDGDTATANLTISVIDDVPTARADTDAVAPATYTAETGNVLTGAGTTSGAAGADTQGADGATLTGITAGSGAAFVAPGTVIQGQYGTLTIDAQGNYSYVRDANTPGGVNDIFSYRLTDGDGDTSDATLTIAIGDSPAVITFVPTQGAGTVVDESQLPPRSGETEGSAFDGDDEATTGTITFTSPDGVQSVTIAGVTVNPGALPQTILTDATGTLVINSYVYDPATGQGSITYTYTLNDNTQDPDGTTVSFDVVVTDLDGDTAPAVLDINIIDDVPLALDDVDSVTEDGPLVADGNVLTGMGGTDANATDGVADTQGADGATVTAVTGGSVGAAFATAYGTLTLNADGSYSYALNNAAQPVQGLSAGETLTETFTYTITDGDGDIATATLTVTINGADDGVTITGLDSAGGELTVDEDDLPDGSSPNAGALAQNGSFDISTPDGLSNVTIGGTQVVTNGVFTAGTATSPLGMVNITGFTPVIGADGSIIGGTFAYEYVLADNTLTHPVAGEDNVTDSFAVTVTDSDGSSANASLDVVIVDDVPLALDDVDSVTEDGPLVADGNVLTGMGGTDANATDGVADTQGADGATVTAVTGGSVGAAFATAYGTLTLNADGSYSYALNNAAQPVQGLSAGETLTETFTYTITDGDGDIATATLTVTINGSDDGVTITGLDVAGGELTVDEDDLPDGSSPNAGALAQNGSFDISTPDGLSNVTIGGTQVVTNGVFTAGTATSPLGMVNITGFTPVIGADGSIIGGTFAYEYVLADNTLTHPVAGEDNVTDSFAVTVTDSDGSSANASLDVVIVDDVPLALDDVDSVTEDGPLVADGNVLTGMGGTDANATDGVADTQGADGATVTAVTGGSVGAAFATAYGTLTLNADGSYSYALNNAAQPVQGLSAGETLTETFTYTITDGDGDIATATLTVTINGSDDGVTITGLDVAGGELTVDEDDLPDGSSPNAGALAQNGSFDISTPDGLSNVTIGGTQVVTNGVFTAGTATSPLGMVNITGFTPVIGADGSIIGGTFAYEYVLADNTLTHPVAGEDNVTDSFAVTVTDSDGSSANASLDVVIVDDVPLALDDVDSVTEDGPLVADGNVLTGMGGTDANATDGVADTQGADGATVTAVTGGSVGAAFATAYGTLTLNADGSYSYALNNAAQPVQGLSAGETLTETFTYTITDGDGDIATATLTVTINGADDGVTITGLDGAGAELLLDEDDLPARGGEPAGSDATPDPVMAGGNFSVSTPDGMGAVVLNSFNGAPIVPLTLVTADGSFTPQAVSTAYGTLNITGFTPVVGADGSVIGGSFAYSYTLADNRTDHVLAGEDNLTDSIGVTVTDSDGSSASATIDIQITDDVPMAINDSMVQPVENQPVTINVLTNDTQGADGVQASTVQLVAGSLTGNGMLVNNGDGSFTYNQAPGEVGAVAFQYQITDGDGDTSIATATITLVADSIPAIRTVDNATVDEDGLPGANIDNGRPGEVTSTGSASATGTIVVDFGGDVPATLAGSLVLNDMAGLDTQLTVDGVPVTFAKDGADLVGSVGTTEIVRISISGVVAGPGANEVTYTYSVTLAQSIDQAGIGEDTDILSAIGFTVTDNDGSTATGAFSVTIVDDVPLTSVTLGSDAGLVLTTQDAQTDGDPTDTDIATASVAGLFTIASAFGADGAGTTTTSYAMTLLVASGSDSGLDSDGANIFLYDIGGVITGSTSATLGGVDVGNTIFSVAVDATTGLVTLSQFAEIDHALPGASSNYDTQLATLADSLIGVTAAATITDGDGDTATASQTLDLGGNINFADDGPTVSVTVGADGAILLTTQDAQTDGDPTDTDVATASFAGLFTVNPTFGADGPGTTTTSYALGLTVAPGTDSGLASNGADIFLYDIGGVITGSTSATLGGVDGANTIFSVAVDATTGLVTLSQFAAIDHDLPGTSSNYDAQLATLANGLVQLTATATTTDGDGDTATGTASVDLGGNIRFADDGPTVDVTKGSDAGIFLTTQDAGTDGTPTDQNSDTSTGNFAGAFGLTFATGADGAATPTLGFSLGVTDAVSGLSSHGVAINLYNVGGVIVGSTALTAPASATDASVVFAVSVAANGAVTLTQYQQIDHALEGTTTAPFNDQFAILADGKIALTASATITDNDGDTATDSETIDLGGNIRFADDGPDINATLTGTTLRIDETDGVAAAGGEVDPVGDNLGMVTVAAASLFTVSNVTTSADSPTTLAYALQLSSEGVPSGLLLSTTNAPVLLFNNGGVIEGRVGNAAGPLVFSVAISPTTGAVTLTQFLAVEHFNTASNDEDSTGLNAGVLSVVTTATDFDGDTDTASVDLGSIIRFEDDGPTAMLNTTGLSLAHDETPGIDADAQDVAGPLTIFDGVANKGDDPHVAGTVIGFSRDAAALSSAGSSTGSDGGTIVFGLNVSAAGVDSGLDTTEGQNILLYLEAGIVVGRVGGPAGAAAFAIAVEADGSVNLVQYLSIQHPTPGASHDESVFIANGALLATVTVTDNDNDVSSTSSPIGGLISFQDDGPTLGAFTDVTVVNATNAIGNGTFAYSTGADGHGSFTISGPALPGITYTTVQNANGALLSATTDPDGPGGNPPITVFTLQVNIDGTYAFTLVTPQAASTETVSLLNLSAGGPTPFVETADGRVEFTGSGSGINSSTQGFGVANQFVGDGESFTIEFHNPGAPGDQAPLVNPDYVSSIVLKNDNINGSLSIKVTVFNDALGTSEVVYTNFNVTGTSTLIDPVMSEFNRVLVEGVGGNGQGVRFTSLDISRTILPNDIDLQFNVTALDGDGDVTSVSMLNVFVDAGTPPIAFDLDGNGVEFLSIAAGVTFDYHGTGAPVGTAWVGPNDGLLALDANGNGRVDNGTELVFGGNGLTDLQGLAAKFDTNGDGQLTSADADYARFGIWQDANSNGVSDDGEFRSLAETGIVSIALVSDEQSYSTANGGVFVFGETSYQLADGTVRVAADAAFATNKGDMLNSVRSNDRPTTVTPMVDALVAASLIAMAQATVQFGQDAHAVISGGGNEAYALGAVASLTSTEMPVTFAALSALPQQAEIQSTPPMNSHASQNAEPMATAQLDDLSSSHWLSSDALEIATSHSTDALFDAVPVMPQSPMTMMDGLLALGAVEAAQIASADTARHSLSPDRVLADVLETGGVDHLINAIIGESGSIATHGNVPSMDFAQFFNQQIHSEAAIFIHQPIADSLNELAAA